MANDMDRAHDVALEQMREELVMYLYGFGRDELTACRAHVDDMSDGEIVRQWELVS